MSENTPTERFEQPQTDKAPGSKSKKLIVILSVIGALLLIAVVVLLTLLISGGIGARQASTTPSAVATSSPSVSPSPSVSAEPSPSPSLTPSSPQTPPPPPPTTGPVFNTFAPTNNTSVGCTNNSDPVTVTFTWSSTGATEAAIGVGTTDAFAGPYQTGLPPSGSFDLDYVCSNDSQIYTVSIRGNSGQTNKTITLMR